ncbi:uncharacterized protein LOC117208359 [Bombus bifarius]|uniref:Uncharacterized protein LOC117208359 n=1 Tax=Bombus bifarius TaxID=103933 RepID=A0A6P8MB97_9HYME|nr:uncharacterized protein LOC117158133 isoform X1 [Bombus vancouverensis nearcticus]XP_033305398.1 uncharacterized protein LOC117208359 [Bombus bifarius]
MFTQVVIIAWIVRLKGRRTRVLKDRVVKDDSASYQSREPCETETHGRLRNTSKAINGQRNMQSATSFAYNRVETISDHYDEVLANRLRRMRKKVNWTYCMFSTSPVLVSSSRRPIVVPSSSLLVSDRLFRLVKNQRSWI